MGGSKSVHGAPMGIVSNEMPMKPIRNSYIVVVLG